MCVCVDVCGVIDHFDLVKKMLGGRTYPGKPLEYKKTSRHVRLRLKNKTIQMFLFLYIDGIGEEKIDK